MTTYRELHGEPKDVSYIDLNEEEFYYHGERLTEERAEQIAQETLEELRRRNLLPGGKSLSGDGKHSPTVQFRVPETLRARLDERAKAEGISPSKLARKALEQYLAS